MKLEHKYEAGLKHLAAGRLKLAETSLKAVCDVNPGFAPARYHLAMVLRDQGRFGPAAQAFGVAARLAPEMTMAHYGAGAMLYALGNLAEAEVAIRRSLAIDPTLVLGQICLANIERQNGRLAEARAAAEAAVRLAPDHPWARSALGFQRLLEGDFAAGLQDFEFRTERLRGVIPALNPQWRGEDPTGMSLLLYWELGLGDSLQFLRYAQVLRARGARVLALVQGPLAGLAARTAGVDAVMTGADYPPFDACCPLPSLPLFCGTNLDTIPAPARYVSPSPERLAHWRAALDPSDRLTVAFAWAGNPEHFNDLNRSMRLADFAPLFRVEGVRWLSVQKGEAARALKPGEVGGDVVALDNQIGDLEDTAAILDLADLVITVDTAVCHLAGALGRPTWTLLPFAPDWRWLTQRTDSPWYPSMRLYRQPGRGDWASVIAKVAVELDAWTAGGRMNSP